MPLTSMAALAFGLTVPANLSVQAGPVWTAQPGPIQFTQGKAAAISVAGLARGAVAVRRPLGDPALPQGVTYDEPNQSFVYDGKGAIASTAGHMLIADDGLP